MATDTRALERQPRRLAHNANYGLLWTGQFVSQVGDRLAMVAFPWLIYVRTGSVVSTGVMLAASTLPYVVFGMFAGVLIDRLDRRLLMVLADIARAALVASVPFAAVWNLDSVYVISFAMASVAVFFDPCRLALLPDLVRDRDLLRANSLLATGDTFTEIVGYAGAGFLLTYVSTDTAFRLDAVSFLVSAGALALMRYRRPARAAAERAARSVLREAREGLAFLRRHRGLLANTVIVVVSVIGVGATYPLTFFFAVRTLDGGTRAFGLFEASLGVGFLVGSIALAGLGRRVRAGYAVTVGLCVMGAGYMVVAAADRVWLACIPLAVTGAANAMALISIDTYVQRIVPEELRGRVWGARFTLTQSMYAVAVLGAGALAAHLDVRTLIVAAGLLVAASGLGGLLVREVREA